MIDARSDSVKETDELASVLDRALTYIKEADSESRQLVESQLKFVAALRLPHSPGSATVWTHGYICPFDGDERTNARFLAVRLVWAAAYTKDYLDAHTAGRKPDEGLLRRAAYDAEKRFASGFPDKEAWLAYINSYHPGVYGRA